MLLESYSSQFSPEILDSFAGALLDKKTTNIKGQRLKEYCSSSERPANSFKEVPNFEGFDFSCLHNYHTLIIQYSSFSSEQIQQLKGLCTSNISPNFLFFADSQKSHSSLLRSLVDDISGLNQLYFENPKPKTNGDFCDNLIHVVCSIPVVVNPPLKYYHGPIHNLGSLIDQIAFSDSNKCIKFINMGRSDFVNLQTNHTVEYIGGRDSLKRLRNFLQSAEAENSQNQRISEDVDENETGSPRGRTSTQRLNVSFENPDLFQKETEIREKASQRNVDLSCDIFAAQEVEGDIVESTLSPNLEDSGLFDCDN